MAAVTNREELPVNGQEVARMEKIAKKQNLQRISKMVCQENDVNVCVLIGANYSKAIEPVEVIPIQKEVPYAFRKLLGWCM